MISILDFSLKSTLSIDVDLKAEFDRKLGGFIVHFYVSFISGFGLKEEDLKAVFSFESDLEFDATKVNKFLGLPIYMVPKILKVIHGDFDEVSMSKDNEIKLKFHIPFKMADFSSYPYIKIKSLASLVEQSKDSGTLNRLDTDFLENPKLNVLNTQESGNEGSFKNNRELLNQTHHHKMTVLRKINEADEIVSFSSLNLN